jgi:hypothetical protein
MHEVLRGRVPEITSQVRIVLAHSWIANAEQITAAGPDLVIASVPYQERAVIEILKGKPLIVSQPWVAELVEAAGGATPGRQISAEELTGMDPEVWIAAWCGAGDRVPLEKNHGRAQLAGNSRGSGLPRLPCSRRISEPAGAPTLVRGRDALASAIPPQLFRGREGIRQITGVPSFPATNLVL